MTSSEVDRLAAERTVVLTTFRRDGRAVPTPIWVAALDGELVFWSDATAGKIKRIRNSGRVEVQASDVRGRKVHGAKVTGEARLLDGDASERARTAIARAYGILGQTTMFFSRLRGREKTVGIAVTLSS